MPLTSGPLHEVGTMTVETLVEGQPVRHAFRVRVDFAFRFRVDLDGRTITADSGRELRAAIERALEGKQP